ncbi:hypothetical protein ACQJBY_044423 [Aegilops geniculata]
MGRRRRRGSGVRWLGHYSSAQSILVIGDGDFSFSLALAAAFGSGENIVTTSLDSYEALICKYSKAETNVMELERRGATVLHRVNANNRSAHTYLKFRQFDRIVFNFPHAGFKGKEEDMRMVNSHRKLVKGFFGNARRLLQPYSEIHISHKIGYPYDAWDLKRLASESFLDMIQIVGFHKHDYPSYNQKKGDGPRCNEPFHLGVSCTFKFCLMYFY